MSTTNNSYLNTWTPDPNSPTQQSTSGNANTPKGDGKSWNWQQTLHDLTSIFTTVYPSNNQQQITQPGMNFQNPGVPPRDNTMLYLIGAFVLLVIIAIIFTLRK